MYQEGLAASLQFTGNGFFDDQFIISGYKGFDGPPLLRRCAYYREVSDA
jgi:hypothetical protein